MTAQIASVLVAAPNWLGDAVMALPAIADIRNAFPSARLTVAARSSVAGLFALAPFVDERVTLGWNGGPWRRRAFEEDAARLREHEPELAILFPNSFAAAWLVKRAEIAERWGYAGDLRSRLLSRAVPRPSGSMHQGAYYQHLTRELGIESGPLEPAVAVPDRARAAAGALLEERGWNPASPLVALASGAAYGTAKRWMPRHAAALVTMLARRHDATCAFVGSRGDAATTEQILSAIEEDGKRRVIDLTGATTIETLAGVLEAASACVSNDSGAMHLAAAVGTPIVAMFGPTNEYETAPLTREGRRAVVLTHPVWCRPCMLRECPIDHRCMKGITPAAAYDALMGSDPLYGSTQEVESGRHQGQTRIKAVTLV